MMPGCKSVGDLGYRRRRRITPTIFSSACCGDLMLLRLPIGRIVPRQLPLMSPIFTGDYFHAFQRHARHDVGSRGL